MQKRRSRLHAFKNCRNACLNSCASIALKNQHIQMVSGFEVTVGVTSEERSPAVSSTYRTLYAMSTFWPRFCSNQTLTNGLTSSNRSYLSYRLHNQPYQAFYLGMIQQCRSHVAEKIASYERFHNLKSIHQALSA